MLLSSFPSFFFIRHGETDHNARHIIAGSTDVPLNVTGQKQADHAGHLLSSHPIKTIVSSPLQRAYETAERIQKHVGGKLVIEKNLREVHLGCMEEQPLKGFLWWKEWQQGKIIDNAETAKDFSSRIKHGLAKAFLYKGPILIVSHGGVWGQILKDLSLPFDPIKNAWPYFVSHCPEKRITYTPVAS